jgi:serine/threonine protein kinase
MLLKYMAEERLIGTELSVTYRLAERLGSGSTATVHAAYALPAETPVAIKIFDPSQRDSDAREEARNHSRLTHPRILRVYGYGTTMLPDADNKPTPHEFIVMEFANKGSLREKILREGALPATEAVRYLVDAADGLQYAHRHGRVHRDVKPGNILLVQEPDEDQTHAKISDLGITVPAHSGEYDFTKQVAKGSYAYMAPEQFNGMAVERSDLYSLGAVAFELLTGEKPFDRETVTQTVRALLTESPPTFAKVRRGSMTPHLSALEPIVKRALKRNFRERQRSVGDFAEEMQVALGQSQAAERRDTTVIDLHTETTERMIPDHNEVLREVLGKGDNILSVSIKSAAEYRRNRRIQIGDVDFADNNTIFPGRAPRLFTMVDRNTNLPPASAETRETAVLRLGNLSGELANSVKDPFIPGLKLIGRSDENDGTYDFEMADYDPYAPVTKPVPTSSTEAIVQKLRAAGATKFADEVEAAKKLTVDRLIKIAGKYLVYTVTENGMAPFQPQSLEDLTAHGLLQNEQFIGEDSTYATVAYFLASEIYGKEKVNLQRGFMLTKINTIDIDPHTQVVVEDPDSGQISILDIPQLEVRLPKKK